MRSCDRDTGVRRWAFTREERGEEEGGRGSAGGGEWGVRECFSSIERFLGRGGRGKGMIISAFLEPLGGGGGAMVSL